MQHRSETRTVRRREPDALTRGKRMDALRESFSAKPHGHPMHKRSSKGGSQSVLADAARTDERMQTAIEHSVHSVLPREVFVVSHWLALPLTSPQPPSKHSFDIHRFCLNGEDVTRLHLDFKLYRLADFTSQSCLINRGARPPFKITWAREVCYAL